jgi:hypothetical protein
LVLLIGATFGVSVTTDAKTFTESESNDSWGTANEISIGDCVYGYCGRGDDDYFRLTVNSSQRIKLTFNHEKYNIDARWCVGIMKYDGQYTSDSEWIDVYCYENDGVITKTLAKGTYYIWVSAGCINGEDYGYYLNDLEYNITVAPVIQTLSSFKVSTRNTTSLKLSWSKVSGVSGYQLQRKSGDSYKTLTNTTSTSYTVKDLSSGTAYTFRVRAYKTIDGKKYYSSWKSLSTVTKPSTPSIKAPTTNSKHQIIAKWNKVSKCTGYQVQYSKKKDFSSVVATKTVSGQSKTSYTGKNFTKGKTYYVRVRAYRTYNDTKYYSSWSSVKSIKCK